MIETHEHAVRVQRVVRVAASVYHLAVLDAFRSQAPVWNVSTERAFPVSYTACPATGLLHSGNPKLRRNRRRSRLGSSVGRAVDWKSSVMLREPNDYVDV